MQAKDRAEQQLQEKVNNDKVMLCDSVYLTVGRAAAVK